MKKDNVKRRIVALLAKQKLTLFFAITATIIQVAASLVIPIVIGMAIDQIRGTNDVDFTYLLKVVYMLLGLIIINGFFGYFMQYLMNRITNKLLQELREKAFYKLEYMPIAFLDSASQGDLIMRLIGDVDQLGDGLLQALNQLVSGLITIITTLVFMLVVSYQVALIVICLTPLSLLTASLIARASYKTIQAQAKIKGEYSGHLNEMFDLSKVVIAYDYQDKAIKKAQEINERLYKVGVKAQFYSSLVNPSTRLINSLVYASVGVYGAMRAVAGLITVGDLTVFLNYASSYTKPFNDISSVASELQNSFASARRIFALIDLELEKEEETTVNSNLGGNVTFKDVSFSYVKERPLITNFSLDIKSGTKVAIVGPTGAGKTTIINLLMRFYEINSGQILIDGKDIKKISKQDLRNNIGMVLQETWLYKASIKDNISYGSNASLEEVKEAATKAFADDFINRMEKGYETIVSDDSGLSVGEKQLLCISRLMLRDPNILILDEATSNIDTRTEQLVQGAFLNLMKNKTAFIIAHRLSTIKNADIILVLKDGNIVEMGNHKELLAKDGFYKSIYESQFAQIST